MEQVRAEAQLQVEQVRAEAIQAEQARAEAERSAEAIRREAEERVAREAARVEAFKDALGRAEQRARTAEAAAEASSHRVAAIEGSTLWRATAPLRWMAGRFPRASQGGPPRAPCRLLDTEPAASPASPGPPCAARPDSRRGRITDRRRPQSDAGTG